ncbi:MAG: hypothetical protein CME19_11320 [Gemmatimonadetes bacterium]|nr:hypothetical protein [Gemmatimonadota bacterium]
MRESKVTGQRISTILQTKLYGPPDIQWSMPFLRHLRHSVCLLLALGATTRAESVITGSARNVESGETLFPATIRVVGTHVATVTNPDGRFETAVGTLPVSLACSHIGYRTDTVRVETAEKPITFLMIPVMPEMETLVVTAEDPAFSIMRKVIERKKEWKSDLPSLKANAYTRMTLRKDTTIGSVIESLSDAFWREGKGWRELLRAKRTTRNMEEDLSLLAAAFVNSLYEDDVFVSGHTLHGVTHPDALETYDFKLTSRRRMDDQTV